MTPVIPTSTSTISLIPGCTFETQKTNGSIRCCNIRKSAKRTLYAQDCVLPLSTSLRFFPHIQTRSPRFGISSATGVDVAVEQADQPATPVSGQDSGEKPAAHGEESAAKSKQRSRPTRKSEMPPVKDEELVPGATFKGKVRSIQPFGAFIDFGAFTDGLVHVSRLSDSYVKDVASVVSVGQEVTVKLVEANTETGRIALTMREKEPTSGSGGGGDASRPPKRASQKSNPRKQTKFVKGQDLDGTVKNLTRSGAFISLPEGEEGFLPQSEEADEGFGSIMGESSLEVGQEVKVRVLRIARGQVTLTMKKDEDSKVFDSKLQGTVFTATNPFLVAFRKNKDIASFLDDREITEDATEVPEEKVDQESQQTVESENKTVSSESEMKISDEETRITSPEPIVDEKTEPISEETSTVTSEETEISSSEPVEDEKIEQVDAPIISENFIEVYAETEVEENEIEEPAPKLEVEAEIPAATPTEDETVVTAAKEDLGSIAPPPPPPETATIETEAAKNEIEEQAPKLEVEAEIPAATPVEDETVVAAAKENGGSVAPPPPETATKATISPALVKQLREETGAGMMDCKKALSETAGDLSKAQEYLRKKGLASADKKASRTTAEGRIGSYVHDSRIGVLIEVNCETDFVSRGEIFKELVNDLAMQVAACPQVQYLVPEDVPKSTIEKEKEIEMQKEDLLSKPEQFRVKIVEGRIKKRLDELALLEQAYIKNDKVVVKDFVKSTIATIGENIKVKRFVRFNLGEGLEKRSQDFAAEVAAQTSAKKVSAPAKEPAATEAVETTNEAPKVAISAALVKQLREESGAGMMDCKKALSETGGDLEKAQEYLRKKGLSTADKKSSRLAAEGRIGSYIHDARIGVLIEVNCETDFVGRSEKFKELVEDLAMQVVACPKVEYVSIEDIPESIVQKEKAIEMQREDILSKPENIREKIVDGRVSKRLGELALLEQPYLKDDGVLVKDLVKQTVAAIGENVKVRRFVRFTLGESVGESTESVGESSESETES